MIRALPTGHQTRWWQTQIQGWGCLPLSPDGLETVTLGEKETQKAGNPRGIAAPSPPSEK